MRERCDGGAWHACVLLIALLRTRRAAPRASFRRAGASTRRHGTSRREFRFPATSTRVVRRRAVPEAVGQEITEVRANPSRSHCRRQIEDSGGAETEQKEKDFRRRRLVISTSLRSENDAVNKRSMFTRVTTRTATVTLTVDSCREGFDWRMLLSGAWFETIATALLAVLVLAAGYRPPWWFWTRNYNTNADAGDNGRKYKTARDVPGPFALPILGTRWIFSCLGYYRLNKIHEAYTDLNRRYGPLCKEEALWNCLVVSVFSRHDIEAVLKRGSRYPLRPPQEVISHYRRSRRDRYTNLGLVNEQGVTWQKLRAALTPELTGAETVFGFFPALNVVTDGFIDLIRERRASCFIVRGFEELAYRMGLESTCTLILGRHLGLLKPDSSSTLTTRLAEAVRIHFTASRDAFYGLPLWKLLPTSAYKQLIESEDTIYTIISDLVETTMLEKQDDARDESIEAVFLSILRQKDLDMRDKKAAIVDFIAAGIHTLGNTLVFLFNLIGRNPEVQETLYNEAQSLAPPGCDLTVDDLRKAKYLRACISESFRIVPTTPCIARILDEPIELRGYHLDAGTVVLLHTWIAGMSDDNFKDASKCLPERWLKPTVPHSPLLVAPFGAGRRICPGKRFVELALQLILAKIVREFEIVVEEELGLQFEFILAPQSPVSLGFRDRGSRAEMT